MHSDNPLVLIEGHVENVVSRAGLSGNGSRYSVTLLFLDFEINGRQMTFQQELVFDLYKLPEPILLGGETVRIAAIESNGRFFVNAMELVDKKIIYTKGCADEMDRRVFREACWIIPPLLLALLSTWCATLLINDNKLTVDYLLDSGAPYAVMGICGSFAMVMLLVISELFRQSPRCTIEKNPYLRFLRIPADYPGQVLWMVLG